MFPRPSGIVTLLTDFGSSDPYVGIMKGALLRASAKLTIVDVSHDVPPQNVATGSFFVAAAIGRFPTGTVHVAVVDPGVGTARRLLAVAARECYWLAPDNGLLSPLLQGSGEVDVRTIDDEHLGLRAESRTFHGRDLLAPAAAWLAGGRYGFSALGPRIDDPLTLALGTSLRVVHVDRFGDLISNVDARGFGDASGVRIAGRVVPRLGTYGEASPGALLAYVGSFGLVEIAKNGGSAARELEVGTGAAVELVDR